jgi:predicted nucleic acid-binding protein
VARAVLDTSVFVAGEGERGIDDALIERYDAYAVSVATMTELNLGVLRAMAVGDAEAHARRFTTYSRAAQIRRLDIDLAVGEAFARLVSALRDARRKAPVQDCWIAATATAHGATVITQDRDDFRVLAEFGGVAVAFV